MRNHSHQTARIRIFMDYWNFAKNWQELTGHLPDKNLSWKDLPLSIIDGLDEISHLRHSKKELRAVKVYASVKPCDQNGDGFLDEQEIAEERRMQSWFQDELDQFTAYTVDITSRSNSPLNCKFCGSNNSNFVEQGIDTKIAIDLVSLASRDLYDIAVLITDDSDLVPSTQCVQDTIDKQVVHLGFRDKKSDVRTEAWGHLFIDDMLSEVLRR
jgi:uncharacterized LabA/DUF88 family protein